MNTNADLERCFSFINCQLQPAARPAFFSRTRARWRAVTISRQVGSGGGEVAEELADYLQAHAPDGAAPWAVLDRNLVAKVLEDHHLPARLAKFMPENRVSEFDDLLDDLLGVHPPVETLVRKTAETILQLAELGNVILIGRGANVVTGRLAHVFHVRLVGSLEKRVARIQEHRHIGQKAAMKAIHDEDRGRQSYLKKYFRADIDDPLLYHVTINTDLLDCSQAAAMIGRELLADSAQPFERAVG